MKVDWKQQYWEVFMSIFEFRILTQESHFATRLVLFGYYSICKELGWNSPLLKKIYALHDCQVIRTPLILPQPINLWIEVYDIKQKIVLMWKAKNTIHLNLIAPFLTWGWSFWNFTVITFPLHYSPFTGKASLSRISPLSSKEENISFCSRMYFCTQECKHAHFVNL